MLKLIAYRLLLAIPQLLAILVLSFLLTYLVPGSPAQALLRFGATPERIAEVEAELGLDAPIHERLAGYIGDAVQGDLGESYLSKRPVTDLIVERLPATLSMVIGGVTVSLILGVGMGILAGTRLDRPADRAVMAGTSIAVSVPQFLLGLFLLLLVSIELEWIPVVAYVRFTEDPLHWARGMLLPSLALGFAASGLIARQMRAGMAAAVHSDYGASLAAAGVSRRRFYFRYGIKNAMVPVLAATGLTSCHSRRGELRGRAGVLHSWRGSHAAARRYFQGLPRGAGSRGCHRRSGHCPEHPDRHRLRPHQSENPGAVMTAMGDTVADPAAQPSEPGSDRRPAKGDVRKDLQTTLSGCRSRLRDAAGAGGGLRRPVGTVRSRRQEHHLGSWRARRASTGSAPTTSVKTC